ncbi:MAG: trypsin-like serine peptidase [Planctomycetia bacterium]
MTACRAVSSVRAAILVAVAIHGAVSRPAVGDDDVAMRAARATVKVRDGHRAGTAFLVDVPVEEGRRGGTLLATAAHVFDGTAGGAATLTFRATDESGESVRREVQVPLKEGDRTLWMRHPKADVAVIALALPAGVDARPFTLEEIADTERIESGAVRLGRSVRVACYPAQVEGHPAGWPVLRHGSIASHPLLPVAAVATFYVDYSQFGGDSGAAVVIDDDGKPVVAGVVVGMKRQSDRTSSPFEQRTVHTPLDLAVTVHPLLLRETIEAWRTAQP